VFIPNPELQLTQAGLASFNPPLLTPVLYVPAIQFAEQSETAKDPDLEVVVPAGHTRQPGSDATIPKSLPVLYLPTGQSTLQLREEDELKKEVALPR